MHSGPALTFLHCCDQSSQLFSGHLVYSCDPHMSGPSTQFILGSEGSTPMLR